MLVCREHCFAARTLTRSRGFLGLSMPTRSIVALNNYRIVAKMNKDNKPVFRIVATSQGCDANLVLAALLIYREHCFAMQTLTQSRGVLVVLVTT